MNFNQHHHHHWRHAQGWLAETRALIIDSNMLTRGVLVSQMRDFGVGTIKQCTRVADARRQLESENFDFVLCEQHFDRDAETGQSLVDDLRRHQLLPLSTIFIMVTTESSYARVAEAAESALDGYLLKPHNGIALHNRLLLARRRKLSLQAVFTAIDAGDHERAIALCLGRFEERGDYWLYAARIAAELLLSTQCYAQAQALYETVAKTHALPWARLGIARAQLEKGESHRAISTLEALISEESTYADAYDVLARAHFGVGRLDLALETYKMASDLTPHSITRLQSVGMMQYFCGTPEEADRALGRAVRLGLYSKTFDTQTLVLLALTRLDSGDRRGLSQCQSDLSRLLDRRPNDRRMKRQMAVMQAVLALQDQPLAPEAEATIRGLCAGVRQVDFDLEAATNLLTLLSRLAQRGVPIEGGGDAVVQALGLRFSNSRRMSELMIAAASPCPAYSDTLRQCHAQVFKHAENAVALGVEGRPADAVMELLGWSQKTLSAKLIETAHLLLQRYIGKIDNAQALVEQVQQLRATYSAGSVSGRDAGRPEPAFAAEAGR